MKDISSSHYNCPNCGRFTYKDVWLCVWCRKPIAKKRKDNKEEELKAEKPRRVRSGKINIS